MDFLSEVDGRAQRAPSPPGYLTIPGRAWAGFRGWRRTRPFWGGLLCILGGAIILIGPISVWRLLLLGGGVVWAGLLTGAVVVLMGLVLWFAPSQRTVAGLLAVLVSVASFVSANLGGFLIGMALGVIGGAMGFAWTPLKARRPEAAADEHDSAQP